MLDEIIKRQKFDLKIQQEKLPYKNFEEYLSKSQKKFYSVFSKQHQSFIFECKYQSPSMGKLREQYPVTELAKKYAKFADVISVLTNKPFFGGNFSHLRRVSNCVKQPVICKDIIIDPYQVGLARLYGADAVLLMLSVLDDDTYVKCATVAHALNMGIVTEVHSIEEANRATKLDAKIIGVNHRNLKNLELDMERVFDLCHYIPKNRIIIAESGIHSYEQIQKLTTLVDGFLIGTTLSTSNNIDLKMRELLFGRIKICGLTSSEDINSAYLAGASFGGLNFIESSKRYIPLDKAKKVIMGSPLQFVGIFANHNISFIKQAAEELNLFAIQLHGCESQSSIAQIRKNLPESCQIWLALDGNQRLPEKLPNHVDKIIVDNFTPSHSGGSGKPFCWEKLKHSPLRPHIILAGGLSQNNILAAKALQTWGLDINSGVESFPGIKDPMKIHQIFAQLRGISSDKT